MPGLSDWIEPALEWRAPTSIETLRQQLVDRGEPLTTWPATPFDSTPTDCFTLGSQYWIWQAGVGAVCLTADEPRLVAYPADDGDPQWFRQVVTRSWLPAVYPIWGRQVIHASAAVIAATGDAIAFTGSTQAGKSTTAYGVSRRPGWRLLSDDTLAFSVAAQGALQLHPLTNESRLRPASAEHFGKVGQETQPVEWPARVPELRAFYALEGVDDFGWAAEFTRLRMAEGLPLLLQQAYALSFKLPKYNQQLMRDYGQLAASVPMYRLRYCRAFSVADELYAAIDAHVASELDLVAAPPTDRPQA